jgi:hypothetical protein
MAVGTAILTTKRMTAGFFKPLVGKTCMLIDVFVFQFDVII